MLIIKLISNIFVSLIFSLLVVPSTNLDFLWFNKLEFEFILRTIKLFLGTNKAFVWAKKLLVWTNELFIMDKWGTLYFDFYKVNRLCIDDVQMMFILTFLPIKIKEILKLVTYQNINAINYLAKKKYG